MNYGEYKSNLEARVYSRFAYGANPSVLPRSMEDATKCKGCNDHVRDACAAVNTFVEATGFKNLFDRKCRKEKRSYYEKQARGNKVMLPATPSIIRSVIAELQNTKAAEIETLEKALKLPEHEGGQEAGKVHHFKKNTEDSKLTFSLMVLMLDEYFKARDNYECPSASIRQMSLQTPGQSILGELFGGFKTLIGYLKWPVYLFIGLFALEFVVTILSGNGGVSHAPLNLDF